MSLLTIVQTAMSEIGLGSPSSVVGNTDPNVSQALALLNRAGKELRDVSLAAGYWPVLRKQYLFNLKGSGPLTVQFNQGSQTGVVLLSPNGDFGQVQAGWQVQSQYLPVDTMVVSVAGASFICSQPVIFPPGTTQVVDSSVCIGQEAYPFPTDVNDLVPSTLWDRNFRWQLLGPVDAQEWQVLKSGISPVGPRMRFRVMQNMFYVNPPPFLQGGAVTQNLLVYEYGSKWFVATAAAPTVGVQDKFMADSDVPLLKSELLELSLKWRILKAKGLAYEDDLEDYADETDKAMARAIPARNLPLNARSQGIRLLNSQQVPDTGFGT